MPCPKQLKCSSLLGLAADSTHEVQRCRAHARSGYRGPLHQRDAVVLFNHLHGGRRTIRGLHGRGPRNRYLFDCSWTSVAASPSNSSGFVIGPHTSWTGRIFSEYMDGKGRFAIAEGLTRDGVSCPSAHDPARNRHRDTRAWSKAAVRASLNNPRYLGGQVWNRERRDEVLLDVEDVAAGHEPKLKWNDRSSWIWSTEQTHHPLASENFAAVQERLSAGKHWPTPMKGRATGRRYALSGLAHCSMCGRRMRGTSAHETARTAAGSLRSTPLPIRSSTR